jgi:hypothetical protein
VREIVVRGELHEEVWLHEVVRELKRSPK